MLSKLLKYEIKATGRTFLPLYLALLIFAAINLLISSLSVRGWGAPAIISMFLYVTILIGIFVMTFIVMIQRFYKNLLSDEGYLMFTLPTKPWMHITSKLLVSMMWMIVSGIVGAASIIIIAMDKISFGDIIREASNLIEYINNHLGYSAYLIALEIIVGSLISLASGILIIYASIALGHLASRHRILASFGAFLALNTITQILGLIPMAIPLNASSIMGSTIHLIIWLGIAFIGLLSAGYFVTANIILSKRLNLE